MLPTTAELIERAKEIVPLLRANAAETEKNGSVPQENIDALIEAGFFKILQPKKFGGYELGFPDFIKVANEIGRGCPSTVWNLCILGLHQFELGKFGEKAQLEVWGENNKTLISSSYAPFGKLEKVEGGWILNGRWPTSSGSEHAQWAFLGAYLRNENGEILDQHSFLVPRKDYTLIDDWNPYGLRGTGSKSVEVKDAFVPEYRTHSIMNQSDEETQNGFYKIHQTLGFFSVIPAGIIGMAQGAIDIFIEEIEKRQITFVLAKSNKHAKTSHYTKDRLANAIIKVRSARARLLFAMDEINGKIEKDGKIEYEDMLYYMLDFASTGRDCSEAVTLLIRGMGAKTVFLTEPLQRIFRDIQVACNHGTQNSDDFAAALGGSLLGEGVPPFLFNIEGISANSKELVK